MRNIGQRYSGAEEGMNLSDTPSTVPKVEDQVSQKFELGMLDIDCGA